MSHLKKTPLYEAHVESKAKMVEFANWIMPVQYEGLRQEHQAVRTNVGLFDVSHMGEIRVRGKGSLETLEWVTTNCVAALKPGQAQYTLMLNERGGVIDDLIVYCLEYGMDYLLCVNAINVDKDWNWIKSHNLGDASVENESNMWAQVAIQGPKAMELLSRIYSEVDLVALPSFQFVEVKWDRGGNHLIAKTGYTGEEGYEVFLSWDDASQLWSLLLRAGEDLGVKSIGLGARDSLRMEMKYSLYGHEIDEDSNPYAAGLGWAMKPSVKSFVGRDSALKTKKEGLPQKLVGFKLLERRVPRQGYKLFSFDNNEIGRVTSGTLSPTLDEAIGIAYIDKSLSAVGTEFTMEIRNKRIRAIVVETPFVRK